MAFSAIELTTISRAHDYTTIKHNEDNKGMVDQSNFSAQFQKTTEQNIREVHSSDNSLWHDRRPDAREKGNGQYSGDGGRKRKGKQSGGGAAAKPGGFDVKI